MTADRVGLQPAFVLQRRPYQETSLLLDVLTADYGRLSLLAKGVRKAKSKTLGLLQPFVPLRLSYVGKSDLKTLTGVESAEPAYALDGWALYCGFYVNELVEHFLHAHDPHPEVFLAYRDCLAGLSVPAACEAVLRRFERRLLEYTGYGLTLDYDTYHSQPIVAERRYRFDPEYGLVAAEQGLFSGASLLAIGNDDYRDAQVLGDAKRLMRTVIAWRLNGKTLRSRAVMQQIIKRL